MLERACFSWLLKLETTCHFNTSCQTNNCECYFGIPVHPFIMNISSWWTDSQPLISLLITRIHSCGGTQKCHGTGTEYKTLMWADCTWKDNSDIKFRVTESSKVPQTVFVRLSVRISVLTTILTEISRLSSVTADEWIIRGLPRNRQWLYPTTSVLVHPTIGE